jgi:hypothetical protein
MAELYEKFCDDLRKEMLRLLPYDETDQAVVADLQQKSIGHLLIFFLNWVNRHVHPHPREVLFSEELLRNPLSETYSENLAALCDKIKSGTDLSPHLSSKIAVGYKPQDQSKKKNLNARKDLDMLLNDWGVHHLHLSQTMEPNGFATRSANLLFAIFMPERAYLLDILPHGAWGDEKLVQIAVRNWPNDELFLDLKGVLPGQSSEPEKEHVKIRAAGLSKTVKVDDTLYMSRMLGISLAETATRVSLETMRFLKTLKAQCEEIQKNPLCLKPYVEKAGGIWPDTPEYRLIFSSGPERYVFSIFVENADTGIGIWPLYA